MGYVLRTGVTFCAVGDAWFFLDLPNDRYACLVGASAERFGALVDGALAEPCDAFGPLAGMIEEGGCAPLSAFSLAVEPAADLAAAYSSPLTLRVAATLALGTSVHALRHRTLADIVGRLRTRKTRIGDHGRSVSLGEIAHAIQFAGSILGAQDRCMALSMACAQMLVRRNIQPELVFGVKDRPFEAHCWVQVGPCIVNDTLERVRAFTPILGV